MAEPALHPMCIALAIWSSATALFSSVKDSKLAKLVLAPLQPYRHLWHAEAVTAHVPKI